MFSALTPCPRCVRTSIVAHIAHSLAVRIHGAIDQSASTAAVTPRPIRLQGRAQPMATQPMTQTTDRDTYAPMRQE